MSIKAKHFDKEKGTRYCLTVYSVEKYLAEGLDNYHLASNWQYETITPQQAVHYMEKKGLIEKGFDCFEIITETVETNRYNLEKQ